MKNIIYFKEIDSTSAYIKRNYEKMNNFDIVYADHQKKGKGRNDRIWQDNKGENLLFSILVKDKELIGKYSSISLLAGAVILSILKNKYHLNNVTIKWPNDIYVNGNKICGILLESTSNGDEISSLVVGIGINVNQKEFDPSLKATSLALLNKHKINLSLFRFRVFKTLKKELNLLKAGDSEYLKIVRNNNYLINKKVLCTYNNNEREVIVLDINDDNSLKCKLDEEIINISSGEITFHR